MEHELKNDLTTGSIGKKLLAFAVPVFGANVLQAMYGTVDLGIVGMFADAAAVSAVSSGSMTMQTLTSVVIGLTMGATVLLGQKLGSRRFDQAAQAIASAFLLFAVLGLVLTVGVCLFAEGLASFMNAPEEAFGYTVEYIRICGAGIICIVLFNAVSGILRGTGDSKTPLVLMAIACGGNIAGDLVCVGVLKMGAAGAALATVLAQGLSVVFALWHLKRKGFGFAISKEDFHPTIRMSGNILKFGTPIAAQELLTGLSFMILLAILNGFGVIASAGVGIAERVCMILFLVPGTTMAAVSAFSAQNVGAGQYKRARQGMFLGMAFSVGIGVLVFFISFFRGDLLASLFTKELPVIEAAADYLRSYSIDCILVGVTFSIMGYLNGHGRTLFVAIQGMVQTFLVRIPVSYAMSQMEDVSLFQIGFATPLATAVGIILCVSYLVWMEKKTV